VGVEWDFVRKKSSEKKGNRTGAENGKNGVKILQGEEM